MNEYRVTWEIDIYADTPEEAAQKAFDAVRRPDTTATVFDVTDKSGETTRVDLLAEEEVDNA